MALSEVSYDQDRALLLRLAARGGDRRAGVCGRVSLHGVPVPHWLALGVNTVFPVYLYTEAVPDLIGIAFGAFADPLMRSPTLSVWESTRHPW